MDKTISPYTLKNYNGIPYTLMRSDGRLERHCEHGIGHTVGHKRGYYNGTWETILGCDGCCKLYESHKCRG